MYILVDEVWKLCLHNHTQSVAHHVMRQKEVEKEAYNMWVLFKPFWGHVHIFTYFDDENNGILIQTRGMRSEWRVLLLRVSNKQCYCNLACGYEKTNHGEKHQIGCGIAYKHMSLECHWVEISYSFYNSTKLEKEGETQISIIAPYLSTLFIIQFFRSQTKTRRGICMYRFFQWNNNKLLWYSISGS